MSATHPHPLAAWISPIWRQAFEPESRHAAEAAVAKAGRFLAGSLSMPFDLLRSYYANSVQFGLIERSLLANAQFENVLCAAEQVSLGPWARSV